MGSDLMAENIPPPPPGFQIVGSGSPPQPQQRQAAPRQAYNGPTDAASLMPALIAQESGGRAGVLGPQTQWGRAIGRTQMLPATAREMAGKLGLPYDESLLRGTSPEAAAYQDRLGQAYLEEGLQRTGNVRDALMYYHGGPDRSLWGPKTQNYADEVLARMGNGQVVQSQAQPEAVGPPPPPPGFELMAEETAPSAQTAQTGMGQSQDDPIDLTGRLYQDQVDALKKGAWVRAQNGEVYQLPGDAFSANARPSDEAQGGNVFVRRPNLEDRIGAFASAASEQIPFLDESVAATTGLLSGQGYEAMRETQAVNRDLLNQTDRGARVAGGLTGFATGFALPGGAYIGRGATGLERAGRAAQIGAGYGALYGAGSADGGLGERLRSGAEGAAMGAVTGGLVQRGADRIAQGITNRAAARAANPSDARILSNAGVELTPGQMLGGGFKRAEDALTSIPFMGDAIRGAQRRGLESFNDAAIADTLQAVGSATTRRGRGRIADASEAFGEGYSATLDPVRAVPKPQGYDDALRAIADDPALPPVQRRNLRSLIANTVGRADDAIDGQAWKRIDSELSADINAAQTGAASAPEQRLLRDKLIEVRNLWSERLAATSPNALEEVRRLDDAFANFSIIRKATSDVASAGRGAEASPASMNRAVRQAAGEGRYARGGGRLQELSDAAMTVLPSSVPDSGTPLRSLLTAGGLGGGAAVLGNPAGQAAAAIGITGAGLGAGVYSRPIQAMLNRAYRASGREGVSQRAAGLFGGTRTRAAEVPLYVQILQALEQEQAAPAAAQPAALTPQQARALGL